MSVVLRIGPRTLYMLSKVSALRCEAQNYWDVPAPLYLPFCFDRGSYWSQTLGLK